MPKINITPDIKTGVTSEATAIKTADGTEAIQRAAQIDSGALGAQQTDGTTRRGEDGGIQEVFAIAGGNVTADSAYQGAESKRGLSSRAQQEKDLQEWAVKKHRLIDDNQFEKDWRDDGGQGGQENQIVTRPGGRLLKRNYSQKLGQAMVNYETFVEYFDNVQMHNEIFPEAKLTLEGFSRTSDGLAPVVSQAFVKAVRGASQEEVKDLMVKGRFMPVGGHAYENKDLGVRVQDLHDQNVLVDGNGNLHVIDPIIKRVQNVAPP